MKKTTHYKGHRWTNDELKMLMMLWSEDQPLHAISEALQVAPATVNKMVYRLRANGIPLKRRKQGHVSGRSNTCWTQGEVEYLIRRREEKATCDEIAIELGRSYHGVNAMIMKLRSEQVPIAMRGHGVRRLWNVDSLKAVALQMPTSNVIDVRQNFACP